MNIKQLKQFLSNQIFNVIFIKKDGSIRQMKARLGVTKYLKNGELKYNPEEKGYITVYDLESKGYRTINTNSIVRLNANGVEITPKKVI